MSMGNGLAVFCEQQGDQFTISVFKLQHNGSPVFLQNLSSSIFEVCILEPLHVVMTCFFELFCFVLFCFFVCFFGAQSGAELAHGICDSKIRVWDDGILISFPHHKESVAAARAVTSLIFFSFVQSQNQFDQGTQITIPEAEADFQSLVLRGPYAAGLTHSAVHIFHRDTTPSTKSLWKFVQTIQLPVDASVACIAMSDEKSGPGLLAIAMTPQADCSQMQLRIYQFQPQGQWTLNSEQFVTSGSGCVLRIMLAFQFTGK
jgi:hypothetical protein